MPLDNLTPTELLENFDLLEDWDQRFEYLIELGAGLPPFAERDMVETNKVRGCTSQVWFVPEIVTGNDGKNILRFTATSDAAIVRGLIAVLMVFYNDIAVDRIADVDIHGAFDAMGLSQNLSPNRRNGFFSIAERIRTLGQC